MIMIMIMMKPVSHIYSSINEMIMIMMIMIMIMITVTRVAMIQLQLTDFYDLPVVLLPRYLERFSIIVDRLDAPDGTDLPSMPRLHTTALDTVSP